METMREGPKTETRCDGCRFLRDGYFRFYCDAITPQRALDLNTYDTKTPEWCPFLAPAKPEGGAP